jgi:hypothetical protein
MKMQGMVRDPMVWETGKPSIAWEPRSREWLKGGRRRKGYNNDAVTDEALAWLKNRDANKPFYLLLHPKPPHEPYTPPPGYEDFLKDVMIPEPASLLDDYKGRTPEAIQNIMTSNRIVLANRFIRNLTKEQRKALGREKLTRTLYQEYIKVYYRLVKPVDDNVARVLDYPAKSGLDKDTLVIYTSDQGYWLGEHRFFDKEWMYDEAAFGPFSLLRASSGAEGVFFGLRLRLCFSPLLSSTSAASGFSLRSAMNCLYSAKSRAFLSTWVSERSLSSAGSLDRSWSTASVSARSVELLAPLTNRSFHSPFR